MDGNAEKQRLLQANEGAIPWKMWGPYLSERQWGTVREDYSEDGNAWSYFTHDQARSRAYRWGEDGLGGICDQHQRLCFALALWNGVDPILKERLFGLSNGEGNHGEDVKEYYFYLDSTPTHSFMQFLYKYPQQPYPYNDLVRENGRRSRKEFEYELIDTGVFKDDRYFDVFVEYAKEGPEDILIRIRVINRGPDTATLHILPTLWFRNTWDGPDGTPKPVMRRARSVTGESIIACEHLKLGEYYLYFDEAVSLLFTENETNKERISGQPNESPYVKDAFHAYVIHGNRQAVNPNRVGTKAAAHYQLNLAAGEERVIRMRLSRVAPGDQNRIHASHQGEPIGTHFDEVFASRLEQADGFYHSITPPGLSEDQRRVLRQALAGMLWTKQYYYFDLDKWLEEHGADPLYPTRRTPVRNHSWYHMTNDDIISMPDKWEYPWYAAWDLAFHTIALNMVDSSFAREQLELMLREDYLHPNGQMPAYEWNFSDVNPPVHAWATLFGFRLARREEGEIDLDFLKHIFQKLLLNFTWWVNRKDPGGRNIFNGGFLGLDNIGVFDRSQPLPTGGYLEQADGTAWMAFYSLNMLEIAIELAQYDLTYGPMALKFLHHFLWIAAAMDRMGDNLDELWDEEDGFFYDVLRLPDGSAMRIKVRSMVGLFPLCAVTVIPVEFLQSFPSFVEEAVEFLDRHPELLATIQSPRKPGVNGRLLLSPLNEDKLRRVLGRMLDEERFLSPYGIRSLSRHHKNQPYIFEVGGNQYRVDYLPAESDSGMFGGNSNWRGPIWFPVNALIIRSLLQYYLYYGDDFKVECPTGSGHWMTLFEVAKEISTRLSRIFLRDEQNRRPVYGGTEKFQTDPHWRDYILFYEYFHGDNGAGLGASHQTGWTGLVAWLIQMFGYLTPEDLLQSGTRPLQESYERAIE